MIRESNIEKIKCILNGGRDYIFYIKKFFPEIWEDKEKFAEQLRQNSIKSLADLLGITEKLIFNVHKRYGLSIIKRNGRSSFENEIAGWLDSKNIKYERNTKDIIKPLELDFYLPKQNLAIEFNGDYWHMNPMRFLPTDINQKNKLEAYEIWQRDLAKANKCKDKGIELQVIWESDWLNDKQNLQKSIMQMIEKVS